MLYIDLEKGITRAQAKAKHPDLPPGGVWRTIKGNHVYILNGHIIAGAGVGKTGKPIKLTKKQLKEHQEHLDAKEAKKKETKKKTTTKKATKKASEEKKTKKTATKKTTKKTSETKETKTKKTTKKASEAKETKTKKTTTKKTATKKETAKKETAKKTTTKKTTKKVSEEKVTNEVPAKQPEPIQEVPKEDPLQQVAKQAKDPIDFYLAVQDNKELRNALKERMKDMEGSMTQKLEKLFKEYGGGTDVPEYKPMNTKAIDDFETGEAGFKPHEVTIQKRTDGREALGSEPSGSKIDIHENLLKEPYHTQRYVVAHEVGHVLSNAFPGLAQHVWDNPQDALGRTNQHKGRFEGLSYSPEKSWAEAFAYYHTEPKWLKEKHPKAYEFVDKVLKKIPNYKQYLDNAFQQLDHMNGFTPDVLKEGTKEAQEHAQHYQEHQSVDWYNGLSPKAKKAVDYMVAHMQADHVKEGQPTLAGIAYRSLAMDKLKEAGKTANEPAPFDPNAPKQKFHRWSRNGYDKRAISAIPVDLGHGEEGFVHTKGGNTKVFHGKTGNQIVITIGTEHEDMHRAVQNARNIINRYVSEGKWDNMVKQFTDKYGISPRYDENGNVKKTHLTSEAGQHTKEAKAKRAEEKYGKYYIQVKGGEFKQAIGATPVHVHPELETFHHEENGEHRISEAKSGILLGKGKNKAEAIENTKKKIQAHIDRYGNLDRVHSQIKEHSKGNPRLMDNIEKSLYDFRSEIERWRNGWKERD